MPTDNQEKEIFNAALEQPPEQRSAFLRGACHGDGKLRRGVEELLQASDTASKILADDATTAPQSTPLSETAGTVIGRYKLLQQIGEGGMGVVYMAEQTSPVTRKVALKIIKLGMDTRQVVARFEAERQALALMDHPNIAKVLDAGATETGRPYFVMELVRGVPITEYCDKNHLPTKQRLDLFMQVCHAVQSAHQKGIIHRDLKPSNILVTLNDGVPLPMVIDFGIAKATNQKLTEKTLFTNYASMIGTPAYMSPEQAEMSKSDVDTRTDIYALGVLLYELLTGTTPFDARDLLARGFDEMRRTIREIEPVPPSTRLTTITGTTTSSMARHSRSEAAKLAKWIRGDLDWIVMKCLEKDRTRRYETANGLAMDVQRLLSHEPIIARPPSAAYKIQKTWRRNKLAFSAIGAVTAALFIGLSASTWLLVKERVARRRAVAAEEQARTEANHSREVAGFLKEALASLSLGAMEGRDAVTIMRETMQQAETRLDHQLTGLPEVQAELREVIATSYLDPGEYFKAEGLLREALRLRRTFQVEEHPDIINAKFHLMRSIWAQKRHTEARQLMEETFKLHLKVNGSNNVRTAEWLNYCAFTMSEHAAAESFNRQALVILAAISATNHPAFGLTLQHLAHHLLYQERFEESVFYAEQAVAAQRRLFGDRNPPTAEALSELAFALRADNQLHEAASAARESWLIHQQLFGVTNQGTLTARWFLAATSFELGDLKSVDEVLSDAPFGLIRPDWDGRSVAGESVCFWLIRTLIGMAHHHSSSNSASAYNYAHTAARLVRPFLLTRETEPDTSPWKLANAKSLAGGALTAEITVNGEEALSTRLARLVEAEQLLLDGQAGLDRTGGVSRRGTAEFRREAVERLVRLYQARNSLAPDSDYATKAAVWRERLNELRDSPADASVFNRSPQ